MDIMKIGLGVQTDGAAWLAEMAQMMDFNLKQLAWRTRYGKLEGVRIENGTLIVTPRVSDVPTAAGALNAEISACILWSKSPICCGRSMNGRVFRSVHPCPHGRCAAKHRRHAKRVACDRRLDFDGMKEAVRNAIEIYEKDIAGGQIQTNIDAIVNEALDRARALVDQGKSRRARSRPGRAGAFLRYSRGKIQAKQERRPCSSSEPRKDTRADYRLWFSFRQGVSRAPHNHLNEKPTCDSLTAGLFRPPRKGAVFHRVTPLWVTSASCRAQSRTLWQACSTRVVVLAMATASSYRIVPNSGFCAASHICETTSLNSLSDAVNISARLAWISRTAAEPSAFTALMMTSSRGWPDARRWNSTVRVVAPDSPRGSPSDRSDRR